jgi:DNA-binding MarR family transcriptional regulator
VSDARANRHEFLDRDEFEAWNALLDVTKAVLRELDESLRAATNLSVTEFDVLITLFNAPDRKLGMTELASRAMLSPSGLTHLVTRMERDGLLERQEDPMDGRKSFTVLTTIGDERLRVARTTHNRVLRQLLLPHLHAGDRRTLARLGRRLQAVIGGR